MVKIRLKRVIFVSAQQILKTIDQNFIKHLATSSLELDSFKVDRGNRPSIHLRKEATAKTWRDFKDFARFHNHTSKCVKIGLPGITNGIGCPSGDTSVKFLARGALTKSGPATSLVTVRKFRVLLNGQIVCK